MKNSLRFPTPMPEAALRRPLLTPISTLSNQQAAIALRNWWDLNTEIDLAHRGMRVRRGDIRLQSGPSGATSLPMMILQDLRESRHEVLLALFGDASAIVMRSEHLPRGDADPYETLRVLPIVLRLGSAFRPADARPDLSLKVRRGRRSQSSPYITLARGAQGRDDDWVNLEAGWTTVHDGITHELRQTVRSDILACARAWADVINDLPILHHPKSGSGEPAEGCLSPEISHDLGLGPEARLPYACPAFLPFIGFSNEATEHYKAFTRDIARWMILRSPEEIFRIDLVALSARMSQVAKSAEATHSACAVLSDGDSKDDAWSQRLSGIFARIAGSEIAPIPIEAFIGQRVTNAPHKLISSWIADYDVAFAHARRDRLFLSSHERLALETRFGRFWQPA